MREMILKGGAGRIGDGGGGEGGGGRRVKCISILIRGIKEW